MPRLYSPARSHSSGGASGPNITSRWSLRGWWMGEGRQSASHTPRLSHPHSALPHPLKLRPARHHTAVRQRPTPSPTARTPSAPTAAAPRTPLPAPQHVLLAHVLHDVVLHARLGVEEQHGPVQQPVALVHPGAAVSCRQRCTWRWMWRGMQSVEEERSPPTAPRIESHSDRKPRQASQPPRPYLL